MTESVPPPAEPPHADKDVSAFLKALASETRQQIMFLFTTSPRLSVGEIAERANLSQSTASAHLAELRRGGLLRSTREGKTVYNSVDSEQIARHIAQVQSFLACCCTTSPRT